MSAFLSIITINYNNARGLQKTIDSVLEQTYTNYEFIVIDGDSKDGSKAVLEKYKERISYCVSEKDSGIFSAMNKGIQQANGNYLQFLNSGDVFTSPEALNIFITHPDFKGDVIYGDYKFEKGEKVYPDILTPIFFMKSSLPHQSTFFKKGVFDIIGNYNESYKIGADRAFYIKCFLSGKFKFKHVNCFLVLYDMEGLSNNPIHLAEKIEEDDKIFKEQFGIFYEDYKNYLNTIKQLKEAQKRTFGGYLKRVKNKFWK
jgi:glycosyltransferase involved in cell wall biosynthesis